MCHSLFSWISLPSMSTSRYVKTNWGYHRAGTNWDGNTVLSSVNREGLNNLHRPFICRKNVFFFIIIISSSRFWKTDIPAGSRWREVLNIYTNTNRAKTLGKGIQNTSRTGTETDATVGVDIVFVLVEATVVQCSSFIL